MFANSKAGSSSEYLNRVVGAKLHWKVSILNILATDLLYGPLSTDSYKEDSIQLIYMVILHLQVINSEDPAVACTKKVKFTFALKSTHTNTSDISLAGCPQHQSDFIISFIISVQSDSCVPQLENLST